MRTTLAYSFLGYSMFGVVPVLLTNGTVKLELLFLQLICLIAGTTLLVLSITRRANKSQDLHYDCIGCRCVDMKTARCSLCLALPTDRSYLGLRRLWSPPYEKCT